MSSVNTPVNIDILHLWLKDHPDKEFVSYLINGLQFGFHTGFQTIPETPFECKNLRSAEKHSECVGDLIQQEVNKGYLLGPFRDIPFKNYRINPIGVAEGKYSKKKRLIVDMSAPHDNEDIPSLNNLIDKQEFSLTYVKIDDAVSLIKHLGLGSFLIKTDITDAFKNIPILEELWPFHGIKWKDNYYFYKRLVFGSRSSPKIFDYLSTAVCWIAKNVFDISNVLHLLDDFLVVVPPWGDAFEVMHRFLNIFKELGIPLSSKKTEGPCNEIEYLGLYLDSAKMETRLPREKLTRITELLETFQYKKSCTKRELLSLLGHLNFACRVILPGRSFISHLIALSTTVEPLHYHIKIDRMCRADLSMWLKFLRSWNGVSFFIDDNITEAADMQLFTDATPISYGGSYENQWFQGDFPVEILQEKTSMAFFELYPIVMACLLWGHNWNRKRILFHCDNMATVEIIKKGRSKVPSIMKLMRTLTFHAAKNHYVLHAKHIEGHKNCIADALSRYQMEKFRALLPGAEANPTPCIHHSMMLTV